MYNQVFFLVYKIFLHFIVIILMAPIQGLKVYLYIILFCKISVSCLVLYIIQLQQQQNKTNNDIIIMKKKYFYLTQHKISINQVENL
jgi:hypothetical protein